MVKAINFYYGFSTILLLYLFLHFTVNFYYYVEMEAYEDAINDLRKNT